MPKGSKSNASGRDDEAEARRGASDGMTPSAPPREAQSVVGSEVAAGAAGTMGRASRTRTAGEYPTEPARQPAGRTRPERAIADSALATAAVQPDDAIAPAVEAEAVGWQNNKRITALWGSTGSREAFVYVADAGWKKLSARSESAALSLTTLAAQGQLARARVDYREDADGRIAEMYVW